MNIASAKHRTFSLIFAAAMFAAATLPSCIAIGSIELVQNGSFEVDDVSGVTSPEVKMLSLTPATQGLTGWKIDNYPNPTSTSGIDLLYSNPPFPFPVSPPAVSTYSNIFVVGAAADGLQFVDLNGTPGPGRISQELATVSGEEYTLTFSYSNNYDGWNGTGAKPDNVTGIQGLVEILDGLSGPVLYSQTFKHDSAFFNNLNWTAFVDSITGLPVTFIAGANPTILRFTSTNSATNGANYGIVLDNVSVMGPAPVSAVPEMTSVATWLLLGLSAAVAKANKRPRGSQRSGR